MTRFVSQPVDLGHGYSVEFTLQDDSILCEWSPDVPDGEAATSVLERYEEARNAFVSARLFWFVGRVGNVKTKLRG